MARREHSATELRQKLKQRGCEESDISATLADLAARGWQSDERYTRVAVRSRSQRGHGPLSVRYKLRQAGIDAETVTMQMQAAEIDWSHEAYSAGAKYLRGKDLNDPKLFLKMLAFLQRRGFSPDQARHALKVLRAEFTEARD